MFATDFLFDQHYASDFGLMICSFDQSPETASGGEIEYNTVKTPGRDRFSFYGAQRNTAIEWHFSICKNPDQNQTSYFTQYEESRIAKWLLQTDGYKLFHFCQEGYEDIFYHACINMTPHQFLGQTVGFDLTVTSDCAYQRHHSESCSERNRNIPCTGIPRPKRREGLHPPPRPD